MKTRPPLKRSRAKQAWSEDIVAALRAKILDGTFSEGQRLPTYLELEEQFHSTAPTVAKALDVLQQHGFVRTEKGRGMYVAQNLPHRSQYGLVFAFKQQELSQFYRAMQNEAMRFEASGRRFSLFYDINGHTDTEDYQRLTGFIHSHRLAGLIFAQAMHELTGLPLLEKPGIPRVAIASGAARPDVPVVGPGFHSFVPKALDYFASRGRRRVAMIMHADNSPWPTEEQADLVEGTAAKGMTTHRCWVQSVNAHTAVHAYEAAQLLMFAPPDQRPDALIIRDDNLVEHATAGLQAAGIRVPEDLDVVAHANFPWVTPSVMPVHRLGYDIRQLFETCIERVDAQRRGERVPRLTPLPAVFEDELPKAQTAPGVFPAQHVNKGA